MKSKKVGAIIAAAGRGVRMDTRLPKQFMPLADEPIFIHSMRKFQNTSEVDDIVLVLPADYLEQAKQILEKFPFSKLRNIVEGGDRRQDSVYQGLTALDTGKYDVFVVHDGVRPLVWETTIAEVISLAKEKGAAITAIPAVDTIKEVSFDKRVKTTLNRSELIMVQTPQAFRAEILLSAMQEAQKTGFYGTDESILVERIGQPVYVVDGSPSNIKITTEADLRLAQALLKEDL